VPAVDFAERIELNETAGDCRVDVAKGSFGGVARW
jgi:hypothetical protein